MDRSKSKPPPLKPSQPNPAPLPHPRPRRRQFTIFGLMVLMFVVSIGFSQLYYWTRAEQRWQKLEQERIEQEKQAAKLEKDAAKGTSTAKSQQKTTPATPASPKPSANTGDAAIAILMAVAMPMLVMILASAGYSLRKWLRRRR